MDGKFSPVFGVITAVQVWKICMHGWKLMWEVQDVSSNFFISFAVERFVLVYDFGKY